MAFGTRERLVKAALNLIQEAGFADFALDQVLQQAQLTKTTFYNHFESKEDLIRAVIVEYDSTLVAELRTKVAELEGESPERRLAAFFDVAESYFLGEKYIPCLLVTAAVSFPNPQDPINQTVKEYRGCWFDTLRGLTDGLGLTDGAAEDLTEQLIMILDGAVVRRQIAGNRDAAATARKLALMAFREAVSAA